MKPVKFGLIGYGLFGSHHAAAIGNCESAELAGIAVRSEESQHSARLEHPDANVTGDYRELLNNDLIEVIDIVVPNHLHFEIARDALMAGKHILLEKPMALTVAHCDELNSIASDKHLTIAINHELRLSSLWRGVRELIDSGVIGDPQFAMLELSRFPYRQGSEGWRWDIERVGNWILEEPIHFFDLALWYLESCGSPATIFAKANSRHGDRPELRDNFTALVDYPGGQYAMVSQTLSAFEHHVTAKIAGTLGTIWAHWSAPDARSDKVSFSLRYGLGDEIHEVTFDKPTGELLELADQIAAVTDSIRHNTKPPCTGIDGRWSTLLCLAAQQSVDTGAVIKLSDFQRPD